MPQQAHERRKFWRAAFSAPVKLIGDAFAIDAMLDDISLKGALLEAPPEWQGKVGERCHLKLRLGGDRDMKIAMWGRITHIDGRRVGLLCESIDLDSATHLRRLVELNAGDPALLERELAALVKG
ncbi:MAG: PilZ domain-containing protein [Rhodocyclales bacterium]|nr:PilZ domain-containing protein [Rhodocyclales bacterium]